MKELENLLNTLIQLGWKPWSIEWDDIELLSLYMNSKNLYIWYMDYSIPEKESYNQKFKTFRELVSLESGLRQFVCANALHKPTWDELVLNPSWGPDWPSADWSFFCGDSAYRLLESALIPEEELGKFLIENIKVEWNQISTPETK